MEARQARAGCRRANGGMRFAFPPYTPRHPARRRMDLCKPCIGKRLAKGVTLSPAHPSPKERTMHYKRISADCHLDMPCMPPELFVENASREMKERMPYV